MELITINPNNEQYYSEDFIKGFECGAQRQFEADKADRQQAEWVDSDGNFVPLDENGFPTATAWCSHCGDWLTASDEYSVRGRFCPNCGYQMRKE